MTTDRELAFHGAMVDLYLRAKREANYNATSYLQLISDADDAGRAVQVARLGAMSPSRVG